MLGVFGLYEKRGRLGKGLLLDKDRVLWGRDLLGKRGGIGWGHLTLSFPSLLD